MWSEIEEPTKTIYQISSLKKFYENFPIQEIAQRLQEYEDYFPQYRRVKGDGNCFYRSFAFLYLRNSRSASLEQLLPCVPYTCSSFPFEDRSSYYDILRQYWRKNIRDIMNIRDIPRKQKAIEKLFNEESEEFDQLIVGYLRSVCVENLKNKKADFVNSVENELQWENKLRSIRRDYTDAEGLEISSLLDFFKVGLTIVEVKEDGVQPIHFDAWENKGYFMILRSAHYEIIYPAEGNYQRTNTPDPFITGTSYILEKKKSSKLSIPQTPPPPQPENERKPSFFKMFEQKPQQKIKQQKIDNYVKIENVPTVASNQFYVKRSFEDIVHRVGVQASVLAMLMVFFYVMF